MDDVVQARETAREAFDDVEPAALRLAIDGRLADASMAPAALATCCARAFAADADPDAVYGRAAGVQLIYEGLRLTRRLAHEEPWAVENGPSDADIEADMDVLVADVLVSRGFYLLARTTAAERAVEVVRAFGRDQTERRSAADPERYDHELEADAFALAVVAGASVADRTPPEGLVGFASDLGRNLVREGSGDDPPLPTAAATLDEDVRERVATLADGDDRTADADPNPGPVRRSATDP
ncbi:MAG: hypothetical protein ABEH78_04815 [Haloferacaceae archaeon]